MTIHIETKMPLDKAVEKARVKVAIKYPMQAFFLLRSKLEFGSTLRGQLVPTAATDGETIMLNQEYCAGLSMSELVFLLVHESNHIIGAHHLRAAAIKASDPEAYSRLRFNIAADYLINRSLTDEGHVMPRGALLDTRFSVESHTVEKVYREIESEPPPPKPDPQQGQGESGEGQGSSQDGENSTIAEPSPSENNAPEGEPEPENQTESSESGESGESDDEPGNEPGSGNGEGEPESDSEPEDEPSEYQGDCGQVIEAEHDDGSSLTQSEAEAELREHSVELRKAASSAKSQGSEPGYGATMLDEISPAKVDWKSRLRDFAGRAIVRDETSWRRTDRRFSSGDFCLPAVGRPGLSEIIVAVDVSGSVDDDMIREFFGELDGILESYPEAIAKLWQFDTKIHIETEEQGKLPSGLERRGYGGTRPSCVFAKVEEDSLFPDCLIIFSDMYFSGRDIPEQQPDCPVLWVGEPDSNPWFAEHPERLLGGEYAELEAKQ